VTATNSTAGAQGTGQYAEVNGINLYFETHGAGRPLILLHGGLGSGEMFGPTLPALAERHQVIVVDLQGHGRTADIDRPLDVRLMADDIAALIDHLGLDRSAGSSRPRPTSGPTRSIRRCAPSSAR
jgi:pimeloyl-ACP methyl ester carboxylesterase